jgi:uncharacterized protein YndB with AHSA1/START domain
MGMISASTTFPAAPEEVWKTVSDPRLYEKWLTIHSKWKGEVPERFTQSAQVAEVVTMLGMPNTITWTVDEYVEPTRMRISGTGMAGVQVAFSFTVGGDGDGGSRAEIDAEFEGQMIVGALGKAVEQDGKKQLDASLANLTTLVAERSAGAAG